jgi:hypothetical protein
MTRVRIAGRKARNVDLFARVASRKRCVDTSLALNRPCPAQDGLGRCWL